MALKRCEHGHHYDPVKHSSCPNCGVGGLNIGETDRIKKDNPNKEPAADSPLSNPNKEKSTRDARKPPGPLPEQEEGVTRRMPFNKLGMDPVVGWLVCVEGKARGRDYRIRSSKNFIGRSERMQICIKGDDFISKEKHAVIGFEPKKQTFSLLPGQSTENVYLNEEVVYVPTKLKPYDIIELGQTKLMFVPLCGEHFKWK